MNKKGLLMDLPLAGDLNGQAAGYYGTSLAIPLPFGVDPTSSFEWCPRLDLNQEKWFRKPIYLISNQIFMCF
jgi:hypothetical protein